MAAEFVVAVNPEEGSSLPFLLRVPVEGQPPVLLKARETWPSTSKVYCHPAETWPEPDALEIVERTPVLSCRRRGAAIDLVLDRSRLARSQFVFTRARGRQMIFWQTARTAKQARPGVTLPTARASGHTFTIVVDSNERYPWRFDVQQADTVRAKLPVGDYAVARPDADTPGPIPLRDLLAVVERKTLDDLVTSLTTGKLKFLLAELAEVPSSAVVVEDRWSAVFKLEHVRPAVVADGLAELAVRYPTVPVVFAETRPLAQEWTYRLFGAALDLAADEHHAADVLPTLPLAGPVPPREPTAAELRAWALARGMAVSDRGRIPAHVREAWDDRHTIA